MKAFLYSDLKKQEDIHFWHIAKRRLIVELIKKSLIKFPKILDIGCGTGRNLEEFNKLGPSWGIDNHKEAVKYCKLRGLKSVKLGRSEKSGFKSLAFDIVTLLDVLEHVTEKATLLEIRRILRLEGLLIVSVPAYQWLWSKWDHILHHKRRYTKNSLRSKLEQNGFKVIYISYVYSYLVIPALLVRTIKSFFHQDNYSSDFNLSNKLLNSFLLFLFRVERVLSGSNTPFGTSIVCVAKK